MSVASNSPINLVMTKQPEELLHMAIIGPSQVRSVGVFSTSGGVLVIVICMASFEGELASLVEVTCFYLPWS
jgi:hypothetical protein